MVLDRRTALLTSAGLPVADWLRGFEELPVVFVCSFPTLWSWDGVDMVKYELG